MFRSKVYTVSCLELGVPANKEASYRAANAWWTNKQAELTSQAQQAEPFAAELAILNRQIDWSIREGSPEIKQSLETNKLLLEHVSKTEMPEEDKEFFVLHATRPTVHGDIKAWSSTTPPDRTMKAVTDNWMDTQRARVAAGDLSIGACENLRRESERFREHVGATTDAATINEVIVQSYYSYLLRLVGEKKITADSAKTSLRVARTIIKHLYNLRLIELPRNLEVHSINVMVKKIEVFDFEQIEKLLNGATGQLRLHVLLALNCGFYAVDISDLQDNEVDWQVGRIRRKRSKERGIANAPEVDWLLWKPTFALLKEYRSGGATVLRTITGGLWCWEEMVGNKVRSSDNVATNFNRLRAKLGGDLLPFKHLRKTGASLLKNQAEYADLASHYLAQVPQTVEGRHYSRPPQERFDEAILWLGSQILRK